MSSQRRKLIADAKHRIGVHAESMSEIASTLETQLCYLREHHPEAFRKVGGLFEFVHTLDTASFEIAEFLNSLSQPTKGKHPYDSTLAALAAETPHPEGSPE